MEELKRFKLLRSQKARLEEMLKKVSKKIEKSELDLNYILTSMQLESVSDGEFTYKPEVDYKVSYSGETEESLFEALEVQGLDSIIKRTIHHGTLKKLYKDIKDEEKYIDILAKLQVFKKPTIKSTRRR